MLQVTQKKIEKLICTVSSNMEDKKLVFFKQKKKKNS